MNPTSRAVAVTALVIGLGACTTAEPAENIIADGGPSDSGRVDTGLACRGAGYPRLLTDTVLLSPGPLNVERMFISVDGTVIAGTLRTGTDSTEAFRWTASSGIVRLGSAEGDNNNVTGMSGDGSVVVGTAYVGSLPTARPFRWSTLSGFAILGVPAGESSSMGWCAVSADGSVVAGSYGSTSGEVMFRWTEATGMALLNPPTGMRLTALSADGLVLLGQTSTTIELKLGKAFRWKDTWTALDPGTGFTSSASLVSADGSVVVGTLVNGWEGEPSTFRWTEGSGLERPSVVAGQKHSRPYGISADGSVIIGTAFGEAPFLPTAYTLAYRWTEATGMKALELLPHPASSKSWNYPAFVSANGTTVIGFDRSWSDDGGMIDESTLVAWDEQGIPQPIGFCLLGPDGVPVEVPSSALEPMAISANGAIMAGSYTRGDDRFGWIAHLR